MVQDREMRNRYSCYFIGYIVAYFIALAYNGFNIFSISPINIMSLAMGFAGGTGLYYGLKPGGIYKYFFDILKQCLACMFFFHNSFNGVNNFAKFFWLEFKVFYRRLREGLENRSCTLRSNLLKHFR